MSNLKIGVALGGIAIALRLASDWLFLPGGPRWYEISQAVILLLGVIFVWPERSAILLRGGKPRQTMADVRSILFTVGINAWWTWVALRARSLVGSTVAHVGWNIGVLWPVLDGTGSLR